MFKDCEGCDFEYHGIITKVVQVAHKNHIDIKIDLADNKTKDNINQSNK